MFKESIRGWVLATFVWGLAVVFLSTVFVEGQQDRGDLYGSRALQSLEQALSPAGTLRFPNYAADPFTCAVDTYGSYYYNTTANESRICDNAGWTAVGGGAGLTVGTANTIPKWNAVPDDLVDSLWGDDGTDATFSGTQILTGDGDAANPVYARSAATTTGLFWSGNALHYSNSGTPTVNLVSSGVRVANADAASPGLSFINDTDTGAYRVGSNNIGWSAGGEQIVSWTNLNTAGVGGDIWTFTEDLPILDGSNGGSADVVRGLFVDIANENHTDAGDGNEVYGIELDDITGDANATEVGLKIGSGWDTGIEIDSAGNTTHQALEFTALANTGVHVQSANSLYFKVGNFATLRLYKNVTPNASGDIMTVGNANTLGGYNGSDVRQLLFIDINQSSASGSGNILGAYAVDTITGQANVDEALLFFGDGWDYFLDDKTNAALGTTTWTTNADKTGNAKSGTLKVYLNGTLYHIQLYADS